MQLHLHGKGKARGVMTWAWLILWLHFIYFNFSFLWFDIRFVQGSVSRSENIAFWANLTKSISRSIDNASRNQLCTENCEHSSRSGTADNVDVDNSSENFLKKENVGGRELGEGEQLSSIQWRLIEPAVYCVVYLNRFGQAMSPMLEGQGVNILQAACHSSNNSAYEYAPCLHRRSRLENVDGLSKRAASNLSSIFGHKGSEELKTRCRHCLSDDVDRHAAPEVALD